MNKPIRTYEELLEEKARLKLLLGAQRNLVRADINQILAPVNSAISTVGKFATKDKSQFLLTAAADILIDVFVRGKVLSNAGWVTKLAVPFFMKNFSSHVIADNKDKIVTKLSSWLGKNKSTNGKINHKKKEKNEHLSDEEED